MLELWSVRAVVVVVFTSPLHAPSPAHYLFATLRGVRSRFYSFFLFLSCSAPFSTVRLFNLRNSLTCACACALAARSMLARILSGKKSKRCTLRFVCCSILILGDNCCSRSSSRLGLLHGRLHRFFVFLQREQSLLCLASEQHVLCICNLLFGTLDASEEIGQRSAL